MHCESPGFVANYIATSADVGVFDGESTKDNNDYFQQKSSISSIDLASGEKVELRHLRYFVALAECLNFTRAAERVHITQSTLSHQIRQLEEEIGELLFERVGKRVLITERGELFLSYAAKALKEVDQGMAALKESARGLTGKLRIGSTHTFNQGFIPECIATLLVRHPTVKVAASEFTADDIGERLASGVLDLGISYRPRTVGDLWFEPLYNEQMVLVVSPQHPLAGRKRIRLVELHRQPLVLLPEAFATRAMLDECFRLHRRQKQPTVIRNLFKEKHVRYAA